MVRARKQTVEEQSNKLQRKKSQIRPWELVPQPNREETEQNKGCQKESNVAPLQITEYHADRGQ